MLKNQDMRVLKTVRSIVWETTKTLAVTLAVIMLGTIIVSIAAVAAVALFLRLLVLFVHT